jgi:hypothetical protein
MVNISLLLFITFQENMLVTSNSLKVTNMFFFYFSFSINSTHNFIITIRSFLEDTEFTFMRHILDTDYVFSHALLNLILTAFLEGRCHNLCFLQRRLRPSVALWLVQSHTPQKWSNSGLFYPYVTMQLIFRMWSYRYWV